MGNVILAFDDDEFGKQQKRWYDAMVEKGHTPKIEDGRLDFFALDGGYHNGPGCKTCGWSCCWHCLDITEIPECTSK